MPRNSRNSKNSTKGNSNQFELLDIENDSTDDNTIGSIGATNVTSTRGRHLKCTQPYDPDSPSRKNSVPTKAKATKTALETNEDPLLRIEALLELFQEQEGRAEKRVNREFIRNEVFPRITSPVPAPVESASVMK